MNRKDATLIKIINRENAIIKLLMNSPVGCIFKPDNEKGGKCNVKTDNE